MTPDEVRALVKEALEETVAKAEAEAEAEKVAKALEDTRQAVGQLKAALEKMASDVQGLAGRIEALEKTPATPAAPTEGEKAPAAASFV